jgi:hypothetical protein
MEKVGFLAGSYFLVNLLVNDEYSSTKIRNTGIDTLPIEKYDI